jgi:ribosomal protein S18
MEKNSMGKSKTHEQFIKEIFDLVGNEYEVLEPYVKSSVKILIKHNCDKCDNYEWYIDPSHFFQGNRCPKCSGHVKKNTISFKQEVFNLVGNEYEILGEYVNSNTKILMKHNCDKCNNHEWYAEPSGFLTGRRCNKCFNINKTKTHEQFLTEMYNLYGDKYTILEEYINSYTKILTRHNNNKCNNHEWDIDPDSFLNSNQRCPRCQASRGERIIESFLQKNDIKYNPEKRFHDCKDKNSLPFDFYLYQLNICIEFDGQQHYEPIKFFGGNDNFIKQQEKDKIKTEEFLQFFL